MTNGWGATNTNAKKGGTKHEVRIFLIVMVYTDNTHTTHTHTQQHHTECQGSAISFKQVS